MIGRYRAPEPRPAVHQAPSIRCRGAPQGDARGRCRHHPRPRARPVRARRARPAGGHGGRGTRHPHRHPARAPPTGAPSTSPPTPSPVPRAPRRPSGGSATTTASSPASAGRSWSKTARAGCSSSTASASTTGQRTTWADAGGYLPAQVTTFGDQGATVSITEFADRVVLGGAPFVAVYSRVHVANPTGHTVTADPGASAALVPLDAAPAAVPAHHSVDHDYVVASDRFGASRALARPAGARRRRRLRPPLRAHAHLLGRAARHDRPDRRARHGPRRRVQERLHHHAAHAQRQRARHRCQRLRDGVQPRRDRDPDQPLHAGLLRRGRTRCSPRPATPSGPGSTSTACGPTPCPGPCT